LVCSNREFNAPRKAYVTTEAMCGARTAYHSGTPKFTPVLSGIRVAGSFVFYVMFCWSVYVHLSFFIWALWCLYFCDLRLLVAPFISSNISYE